MTTPIRDFLEKYSRSDAVRLHMPGHKGKGDAEAFDLTEIFGADSLFEADGIIRESEENAGQIFGAHTFYSTEGSSLSIRAMLYLATIQAKAEGREPLVLAARNAHKSFVSAAALIDFKIEWLCSECESYLSSPVSAEQLQKKIATMEEKPSAVYLTSPDYLGVTVDIAAISSVCKKSGALLLVDNAHGAYLKFLTPSQHPIDLGADMCTDSAHKTLHALTGAGYLHISKNAPKVLKDGVKTALSLFASTSPSYLILSSLDSLNLELSSSYSCDLSTKLVKIDCCKKKIAELGYFLPDCEPMKITIAPKSYGYTGEELGRLLFEQNIVPEFCDKDFLVLMPSADTAEWELDRLTKALSEFPKRDKINDLPPRLASPETILSPREAMFSPSEEISVENSFGRVLAAVTVGCPPAVPIVVSGERITEAAIEAFEYYGVEKVSVVK